MLVVAGPTSELGMSGKALRHYSLGARQRGCAAKCCYSFVLSSGMLFKAWRGRLLFSATAGCLLCYWLASRACRSGQVNDYQLDGR